MYVCTWRVWWYTCFADIIVIFIDRETCHTYTYILIISTWSWCIIALMWQAEINTTPFFVVFSQRTCCEMHWNIYSSCGMTEILSFVSDSDLISHFRGVRCLTILYGKSHDVEWNAWICCALEVEMSWYSQKPNLYVTVWNCMYLYVTACNCM